jgi:tetratricopeptide (TPR) repeat protein
MVGNTGEEAMKRFRAYRSGMTFCLAGVLSVYTFTTPATAATCPQWVAKAVSVQGSVRAQRKGEERRLPAKLNDTFCPGDKIRVEEGGRAVLLLSNETFLRLDQNTSIRFYEPERERTFLLDLLDGAAYFISRTPKGFKCTTPYMNAGVEGTEFLLAVGNGKSFLSIFEGTVLAENAFGALRLAGGQSAVAEEGKPPVVRIVARPRDAVQWTLYYPPILPPGPPEPPPGIPGEWQARVSRLLAVGRVDEAGAEIGEVLKKTPGDSTALALQSVIAVAQNDKEKAHALARAAVETDPRSASARIALSYAQQAGFDLKGARTSVEEAVRLEPGNALAWARLSELRMSFGNLDDALEAANRAASLDPGLARTHSVLGFVRLSQIHLKASREAFEKAIVLDQADPLPRLGLGLARIREGDLAGGRTEIEIAASLAPNNSLIRSYLGKAYYEEKRDKPASSQLGMAKELDPNDPTPWFYDAIRKQTLNRPVEALQDLQRSISLNGNRAVYRSRLLLDDDLAARSASLGRIYDDLGFRQLALVEGWKSVNTDPANHSAHRFLADTYSVLPRHEIARLSELLQSQLLQPLNVNPVQPSLGQKNLSILEGAGPSSPSFNEFNPLFLRDRLALQASGVAGSQDTFGEEVVLSGLRNRFSYSLGQFHYETDGFRENNDQRQDLVDAFVQASLSPRTSIQAEFRASDFERGDLSLNFFPDDFQRGLRLSSDKQSGRVGFRHAFGPGSDLIGSFIYQREDSDDHLEAPPVLVDTGRVDKGFGGELQFLARSGRGSLVGGAGHFATDLHVDATTVLSIPGIPQPPPRVTDEDIRHTNLHLYSSIRYPESVTWTIGASGDFFAGAIVDRDQFNPKVGVTWNPLPGTTIRAAAFRVLKRLLINDQTLEPTQVAGFNQFFDDAEGTRAWNYGIAVDRKFSPKAYAGMEYSWRNLEVPFTSTLVLPPPAAPVTTTGMTDWRERQGRVYLYWTPDDRIALSAEYQYEEIDRDREFAVFLEQVKTHRVPLGAAIFHPCGFFSRLNGTWYHQEGSFNLQGSPSDAFVPGSDSFWVVNASIGYRLPGRYGILSLEARNLFDEAFRYQDTDPASPVLQPERAVFFKATIAL